MEQPFEAVAYVDGVELDYGAVTWDWDFGDATDHSTDNPTTHTYQDAGSYTVRVTATYGTLSGYAEIQADVGSEGGSPPDADATLTFLEGGTVCDLANVKVTFKRPGQGAPGILKQKWSYDGVQYEYDYQTQQGPTPPIHLGDWDPVTFSYPGTWMSWQAKNDDPRTFEIDFQCSAGPPATTWPVTAGPVTVKAKNTVVTSATDVLRHHTGDQHQINWNIVHKDVTGLVFNVTVRIYDMSGNVVRTLTPPAQSGPGAGNVTWDGTNDMGQDPGTGVYAYTVSAGHGEGANSCGDMDKSRQLVLNTPTFDAWLADIFPMEIEATLRHSANRGAGSVWWQAYRPDLSMGTSGGHGACAAAGCAHPVYFSVDPAGPWGPFRYVVGAMETLADGANNRDQWPKPALQVGATQSWYPAADNWLGGAFWDYTDQLCQSQNTWYQWNSHYNATPHHPMGGKSALRARMQQGSEDDAIIYIGNHAAPGNIEIDSDPNGTPPGAMGYLYAGAGDDFNPGQDLTVNSLGWRHCLLVVYDGCETGAVDPLHGDLLQVTHDAGASVVMGPTAHLESGWSDIWATTFFYEACVNGESLYAAHADALTAVANGNLGSTLGYETMRFCGSGGIALEPARYGN